MRPARLALCLTLFLHAGCGEKVGTPPAPPGRAKPEVWTTFYPTTWMTRRIAGDLADVVCPLPDDEDPIFWQPDTQALQGYQAADLVVINGAEFEKWVATASLPTARLIDTASAFEPDFVHFEGGPKHSHGPGAAHTHAGIDGHTWLDPILAFVQAQAIHRGLTRLLPTKQAELDRGLSALAKDLEGLDAELKALGSLPEGRHLYASHPAYNYLAKRYGWRIVNLDLDPETMPNDEVFAAVKARLTTQPGTHLLWEATPQPEIAARFEREVGLVSLVVEPCETPATVPQRDYLERWKINLANLARAFAAR